MKILPCKLCNRKATNIIFFAVANIVNNEPDITSLPEDFCLCDFHYRKIIRVIKKELKIK